MTIVPNFDIEKPSHEKYSDISLSVDIVFVYRKSELYKIGKKTKQQSFINKILKISSTSKNIYRKYNLIFRLKFINFIGLVSSFLVQCARKV